MSTEADLQFQLKRAGLKNIALTELPYKLRKPHAVQLEAANQQIADERQNGKDWRRAYETQAEPIRYRREKKAEAKIERLEKDNKRLTDEIANKDELQRQVNNLTVANRDLIADNTNLNTCIDALTTTKDSLYRQNVNLQSLLEEAIQKVTTLELQCQYQGKHVDYVQAKAAEAHQESVTSHEWFWDLKKDVKAVGDKAKQVQSDNESLAHKVEVLDNALGALNKELNSRGLGNATVKLPGNVQTSDDDGRVFDLGFVHRGVKRNKGAMEGGEESSKKRTKVDFPADKSYTAETYSYNMDSNKLNLVNTCKVTVTDGATLVDLSAICRKRVDATYDHLIRVEAPHLPGLFNYSKRNDFGHGVEVVKGLEESNLTCRFFAFATEAETKARIAISRMSTS